MIDEDAYGVLLSYQRIEEDEYGSDEREHFVQRFRAFEQAARVALGTLDLTSHHLVLLGHCVYSEFEHGSAPVELLAQVRRASGQLRAAGFENVAALTYGSRWVEEDEPPALHVAAGPPRVARVSAPSEPLRKALCVDCFSRDDEDEPGWGLGVYVDLEALEALDRTPKNAPTELRARGARFYRISALEPTSQAHP